MALGERLDGRATELIALGENMRDVGTGIDSRGAEIIDRPSGWLIPATS